MIIDPCKQHSDEWYTKRLGIPTASCFDKILSPTGRVSTQDKSYRRVLLAEWVLGEPLDSYQNATMERGNEIEEEARDYFQFSQDVEVKEVGLVYHDEKKLVSCSPDGLIDESGLEVKCPLPGTHIGYLIENKLPTAYISQVQGSMWVCEREKWQFLSYCPGLDPLIIQVHRDNVWIKKFVPLLDQFIDTMLEERSVLMQRGIKK